MDHPFTFRPNSCDEGIFWAINGETNEYLLPESLAPEDLILDIGTHIGSFCYAAARRGSKHVHGFEASPENYQCAARNLASLSPHVTVQHKAVWRSDERVKTLRFNVVDEFNQGAGHVLFSRTGQEVDVIGFDQIMRQITSNGRKRVKIMKIDCEGSEYPILLTSRTLHLIDCIVGEYHNFTREINPLHPFHQIPEAAKVNGYDRYTITELAHALRLAGFDVEVRHHPVHPTFSGWFFARRQARPALLLDRLRWHRDGLKYKVARLCQAG